LREQRGEIRYNDIGSLPSKAKRVSKYLAENTRSRFSRIVAREDEQINLAEAALIIATEEYLRLDVEFYIDKLDRFGDQARERAAYARDTSDLISAVNATLFDDLGFEGNRVNYYDPRNSFLNEVIDRRTGIPITLTIIYMEVARRIGLSIQGVGLPGHFIAKHVSEAGEVFIDPFNGGRLLEVAAIAEHLGEVGGEELDPASVAAATKKQILTRMLSNLLAIYAGSLDYARALSAIERILIINPASAPHIRDRGFLLAGVGDKVSAISELERYLSLVPNAPDRESIRERIKAIRQSQAKLN
jgi:regulator of sirC expression with transglutaminase-like and TPR domain